LSGNASYSCRAADRGSILILTLWVIFLLALLAVAVGSQVEARLTLARQMSLRTTGYHAARTGLARSLAVLEQDTNGWNALGGAWAGNPAAFSNQTTGAGVFTLLTGVDYAGGGRGTNAGLGDEQGRIDLNLARVELLAALLREAGGLSEERAREVAAAINTARTKPPPHSPGLSTKTGWVSSRLEQGPLRSIQELQWISGMTAETFRKIENQVTVHGGYRVNLNTAGVGVLKSLAGAPGRGTRQSIESLTRKILQFRERGGIFKTLGSGEALGPDGRLTPEEQDILSGMAPFVTVASRHFRGQVEGSAAGCPGESRRIDFVWDRNHHKIEFWHED
jgi:type II secretory pathway component PulK